MWSFDPTKIIINAKVCENVCMFVTVLLKTDWMKFGIERCLFGITITHW